MVDFPVILNEPFSCKCGKEHHISIKDIQFTNNISPLAEMCNKTFTGKRLLVVSDRNTAPVIGERVIETLTENGFEVASFMYPENKIKPDERSLGKLMMNIPSNVDGIIVTGSGTLNDLVRIAATHVKCPFVSIPTAPSMDGYASSVSSLIMENKKTTFQGKNADTILCNLPVITDAPIELIKAGFGDIIGKKIAMSDWILSTAMNEEYFCEYAAELVENSTDLCINNARQILAREQDGITSLMKALLLSGIAISVVGVSRPASGTEHLLAHYIEAVFLQREKTSTLYHGTAVAISTLCASRFYEYILNSRKFKEANISEEKKHQLLSYVPRPEEVERWLTSIGLSTDPTDYMLDKPLLEEALLNARFTRNRYTILTFAAENGIIEKGTKYVLEKLYKE